MTSFEFSTLQSPLFIGGLCGSALVLGLIHKADFDAAKEERNMGFDPIGRRPIFHPAVRIRIGMEPVVGLGRSNIGCLYSPAFLLTEVLLREPFSILPLTFAWGCVLFGEPRWGAIAAALGLLWRALVDLSSLTPEWIGEFRFSTVVLKLLWVAATGVWLASVAYLAIAAFVALMILMAFIAAGRTGKRRSSR